MKANRGLLRYIGDKTVDSEAIPFLPIIELAGDHRVLIENHHGVIQYSDAKVGIRVMYGDVYICGCSLKLKHMTKTKLLITGKIDQLVLSRRG